jgi:hypothetical protein
MLIDPPELYEKQYILVNKARKRELRRNVYLLHEVDSRFGPTRQ